MKNTIKVIILLIAISSCKQNQAYKPSNLTKLSEEQLILDTKNHKFLNLEKTVFKNIMGETIPKDSLQEKMEDQTLYYDCYQNKDGEIIEAVFRTRTKQDEELGIKLQAAYNEGPDLRIVKINCNDKNKILNEVYDIDQGNRENIENFDPKIDQENLDLIVSFIEKCGMPTLEEVNSKELSAIFLVLQHAPPRYQSKYIPLLEKSAERGDIRWSSIAFMKDRALMEEGKPQIYGSQLFDNELYELFEPKFVNQRRAEMDMEPIEKYLKDFGIDFKIEQYSK